MTAAAKGSQKWLQHFVETAPSRLQPKELGPMTWISPRAADDFAEHRDGAMLQRLELTDLAPELAGFWPSRGPVWDGLARAGQTRVLVEAKSHPAEFLSPPSAARDPGSIARIAAAFATVKAALGADDRSDWSRVFYQYANRLAFLWFLRGQGVDARLLFVSFTGDHEMHGGASVDTWKALFRAADYALGLSPDHPLAPHVLHVFTEVPSEENTRA